MNLKMTYAFLVKLQISRNQNYIILSDNKKFKVCLLQEEYYMYALLFKMIHCMIVIKNTFKKKKKKELITLKSLV